MLYPEINFAKILFDIFTNKKLCYKDTIVVHIHHVICCKYLFVLPVGLKLSDVNP